MGVGLKFVISDFFRLKAKAKSAIKPSKENKKCSVKYENKKHQNSNYEQNNINWVINYSIIKSLVWPGKPVTLIGYVASKTQVGFSK